MSLVKINNTDLQVLEYRSTRVVTLAQVDAVHARPDGTAGRNFREHRQRLIDGEDFFKVGADEFRRHLDPTHSKFASEDVVLLTEQGYLMLVKSFTDDLAWQVQRQLVAGYFRPTAAAPARQQPQLPATVSAMLAIGKAVSKVPGVNAGIAMSLTLDAIERHTGLPTTGLRKALPAGTVEEAKKLNATQVGEMLEPKKSGRAVNAALAVLGLQQKDDREGWILTDAGTSHGEMVPFTRHGHSGYQPLWHESVVPVLREHFATTNNVVSLAGAPA